MKTNKYIGCLIVFLLIVSAIHAQTDSLHIYMMMAARNNPRVKAAYKNYQASIQRIIPVGELDDPELSLGFYPKPMEQVNGRQVASLSFMQMFPWFGTLKAAKLEKSWMAQAAYQKYRVAGIDVAFSVQKLWYAILSAQEQIDAISENIRLLKSLEEVSLYMYKSPSTMYGKAKGMSGGGRMSDQLRIQVEKEKLAEQKENTKSKFDLLKRQFNILLHRDENIPIALPDTISESLMPDMNIEDIEKQNPMLAMLKAEGQSYVAQGEMARKMGMPMIGTGLEYMFNKKRDVMTDGGMSNMNGMDMLMVMLKVSVPIYRKKIRAQQKEAALMEDHVNESYVAQIDEIQSQYDAIVQRVDEAKRNIKLCDTETHILDNTIQLMYTEYTNGLSTITDILQTQRTLIDFSLKRFDAVAEYNTAVAELEKLAATNDYSINN
jgi:outer membrane protein, heavy metal efflux system